MNLELGQIIHDGYSMYCILLDWPISKVSQMKKKLGEYMESNSEIFKILQPPGKYKYSFFLIIDLLKGRSLSMRISKLKQNHRSEADTDTHFAFAMLFKVNLIVLQDTPKKLVQYQFSDKGPNEAIKKNEKCFIAVIQSDGYKILFN